MQNSIFQTDEWANFKLKTGYVSAERIEGIMVLEKKLPLGRSMLYAPMIGPHQEPAVLRPVFMEKLKRLAQTKKAIFFRLEFDTPKYMFNQKNYRRLGFKKAFEEIQPACTLVLDLTQSENDLLAQMKQKGRYNIKIAEKSKIAIDSESEAGPLLDRFYDLYRQTAARHKITHRNKSYFRALVENLGRLGYARIYVASVPENGKKIPASAAVIVSSDTKAIYLFGASSDNYRNTKAANLLQWQMIKDAKEACFHEYDFFGVAPNDDENHPWAGVTRFKKQFGGTEVDLAGSWDLVFKPAEYQIFKLAEKIRR